jgi:hypothetical protein
MDIGDVSGGREAFGGVCRHSIGSGFCRRFRVGAGGRYVGDQRPTRGLADRGTGAHPELWHRHTGRPAPHHRRSGARACGVCRRHVTDGRPQRCSGDRKIFLRSPAQNRRTNAERQPGRVPFRRRCHQQERGRHDQDAVGRRSASVAGLPDSPSARTARPRPTFSTAMPCASPARARPRPPHATARRSLSRPVDRQRGRSFCSRASCSAARRSHRPPQVDRRGRRLMTRSQNQTSPSTIRGWLRSGR